MLAGGALINSQAAPDGCSSVEAPKSSAEEPMRKEVAFEGLRVELFEDVADPAAAAEGSQVSSTMAIEPIVGFCGVLNGTVVLPVGLCGVLGPCVPHV